MIVMIIRCETCKTDKLYNEGKIDYTLSVHKLGKTKICNECGNCETKERKYEYRFCSRKCMMDFLEKHEKEDYKGAWEI